MYYPIVVGMEASDNEITFMGGLLQVPDGSYNRAGVIKILDYPSPAFCQPHRLKVYHFDPGPEYTIPTKCERWSIITSVERFEGIVNFYWGPGNSFQSEFVLTRFLDGQFYPFSSGIIVNHILSYMTNRQSDWRKEHEVKEFKEFDTMEDLIKGMK